MNDYDWLSTPVGIDADRWVSRSGCRTVLVVIHTMVSCQRLLDVIDYVESDPRVQVVFTVGPDAFNGPVRPYLYSLGALVLPWRQAIRERFDLAVAAACGGLAELHAPLMVMGHGAGRGKAARPRPDGGPLLTRNPVYGLDVQRLTRDGRVLPSALLLTHEYERDILKRQCPEALAVAVVAGDPCFDRLTASLHWRDRYRRALGVVPDQRLVAVSSTWGRDGLFGRAPDLLSRLMSQLPAGRHRVVAALHPAVWTAHGHRQVRTWTRDCRDAGLILLDPADDWRASIIAADLVIGDHGSVTAYGAALGRPVLQLPSAASTVAVPGSAQQLVSAAAMRLDPSRPIAAQLAAAGPVDGGRVAAALSSRPGQAAPIIRRAMYRLLDLAQPGRHRTADPVPVPVLPGGVRP